MTRFSRRPVPQPQRPGETVRDHTAHRGRGRGVQRDPLTGTGQYLGDVAHPGAGLHPGYQITRRVLKHLVHPGHVEDQVATRWRAAPVEAAARSARHDREAVGGRLAQQLSRFLGGGGGGHPLRLETGYRVGGTGGMSERRYGHKKISATAGWVARCLPGTSPHSRGVGKILPGLHSERGSKAQRTSCMVSRSASENIFGM